MKRVVSRVVGVLALVLGVVACTGVPQGAKVVQPFAVAPYMGVWHEVARLDNRFERGLTQVTAEYQLLDDGRIQVTNRGFDAASGEWQQADGVARFVSEEAKNAQRAELEVSFFGPFYASYNVVKLSSDYQYALVVGKNTEFAWLLSKSATPDPVICEQFFAEAARLGITPQQWVHLLPCQAIPAVQPSKT